MDHWGDPWAEDADADTDTHTHTASAIAPPAKIAERKPLEVEVTSPGRALKPIVLNGLEDEAGWGGNAWATTPSPRKDVDAETGFGGEAVSKISWDAQEEGVGGREEVEGFSAWAAAPAQTEASVDGGANGTEDATSWDAHTGHDDRARHDSLEDEAGNEWSRIEEVVEGSKSVENGVSETSDSATTIHADDAPAANEAEVPAELPREDDASTRSSDSHSDGSHNEAVAESPRTSVEEERAVVKSAEAIPADLEASEETKIPTDHHENPGPDVEDDFSDSEDEVVQEAAEAQLDVEATSDQSEPSSQESEQDMASDGEEASAKHVPTGNFVLDSRLLAELFPPVKNSLPTEEAPDDPVSSTSTRKAWYRITRKQTMREYNTGAVDDNYIRVTWKTSHTKTEAVKTVARWVNEDRIAGRGPGARASFFWDSPHSPTDKRASFASLHSRNTSTASASKPVRPVSQGLPPLSTDVSAAFDWSSPSSATRRAPENAGLRSTSSPLAAKHSAITKLQRQSGRAVSMDLSSSPRYTASHRRTSTATDIYNSPSAVTPSITPIEAPPTFSPIVPASAPSTEQSDPWASLGALDTSAPPKPPSPVLDDDDEWGEMIESPAVSTFQTPISRVHMPIPEPSEPPTRSNTVKTTSITPLSARSSPLQPLPPPAAPVHASPIVRLKGTVLPAPAIFGAKALVPTDSEEHIGPHLLKKRDRSREATPEKSRATAVYLPSTGETVSRASVEEIIIQGDETTKSVTVPDSISPPPPDTTPPLHEHIVSTTLTSTINSPLPADEPNWGDSADFSIFESALPPSSSTAPPPAQSTPEDPWSIFNAPPPAEPFVRPAARTVTPPAKQPLTSATSSAQQRKAEEDDVVRGIVEGLPDLGYMLGR